MRSLATLVGALGVLLLSSSEASASGRSIRVGNVAYDGAKTLNMEVRARSIIDRYAAIAKIAPSSVVMTGVDRFGDGDTVVRFEQTHLGLPVIGHGASVRLSKNGTPISTVTDLESELPSNLAVTVTTIDAAKIAAGRMAFGTNARDAHLLIWPTFDRGARLAYAVVPRVPAMLGTAPRAIIDAQTGEVLEVRDTLVFAKASTYQFNPTKTPTVASSTLALAPGEKLTNPFIEATNCIDNKTVKAVDVGIGFPLDVHICDLVQVATANVDGDFVYEPADSPGTKEARTDAFAEVSIYYHTAKAYDFFRSLQGDDAAQVVVDKPLRLVANLQVPAGMASGNVGALGNPETPLDTFQNAFFSPSDGGLGAIFQQLYGFDTGALWFGQGPKRDYAYDGDVVYHEFAHAVVDATLKLAAWTVDARGAIDAPGAMNEGLADYFSSAITGDPDVGEYAATDLSAGGEVIRTLDNKDNCTTVVGEVHYDSTLFSGALWTARQSLPEADRTKFDVAIYKGMRTNPGKPTLGFGDLANLFEATLKTDFPAGATALTKAMTDRGILPTCERILSYEGKPIKSHEPRIGFVAPGKQSVQIKGVAPGIIQVKATLPPNTATIEVSFAGRAQSAGAQNPLGGQSKPAVSLALAKFGKAITWDPKTGHDADVKLEGKFEASTKIALAVPAGTTADTVYVQIANSGDSDASYDSLAFTFTAADGSPTGPEEEVPPPATQPVTTTTEEGCAASPAKSSNSPLFAGILAGALALVMVRRARSRRA